ncbi:MAG: hypothetical protein WCT14_04605 [Treponemataceae bacterium]
MAGYEIGPVGLTVALPQEIPVPELVPVQLPEQTPPPIEPAPLPAYEGTVIDQTA